MIYIVKSNQSIFDIAVQLYGTIEALPLLLNGPLAGDIDLSAPVAPGTVIEYDLESDVTLKKVLKSMDNNIIHTYKTRFTDEDFTNAFDDSFGGDFPG